MTELRPCPFCGGEVLPPDEGDYVYWINHEDGCLLKEKYFGIQTIDETRLAAWNTRAERTCKVEPFYFAKPKTIEDIEAGLFLRCSECHASIDKHKASVRITERRDGDIEVEVVGTVINYCPNCSAKVVEE